MTVAYRAAAALLPPICSIRLLDCQWSSEGVRCVVASAESATPTHQEGVARYANSCQQVMRYS